jgi:hypothetical protein
VSAYQALSEYSFQLRWRYTIGDAIDTKRGKGTKALLKMDFQMVIP